MLDLAFLGRHARWLVAGFLLALASSFGQTFYIALFGHDLRAVFDLSHGQFGGLYTIATLASAITLLWLGKLADRRRLRALAVLTLLGLAATASAMAGVASIPMLVVVLFGLRLFGQGMLSHVAMTAMARWFASHRGRALSVASLGYPAGEAVLPSLAVALIATVGWRTTWLLAAATLALVLTPLIVWLLRIEPVGTEPARAATDAAVRHKAKRQWHRREVLRDPSFHALLPAVLAPSFMTTAVFFHQVHLAESKGWTLTWFAACYPFYAAATVVTSLLAGVAIDRLGAVRLLPFYLIPLAGALLLLGTGDARLVTVLFMLLSGTTSGAAVTILGALWAELYGTEHLGAIRALAVAGMVLSSALGPGVMGWLIDAGVDLDDQIVAMAIYALAAAGLCRLLTSRLHLQAAT